MAKVMIVTATVEVDEDAPGASSLPELIERVQSCFTMCAECGDQHPAEEYGIQSVVVDGREI